MGVVWDGVVVCFNDLYGGSLGVFLVVVVFGCVGMCGCVICVVFEY